MSASSLSFHLVYSTRPMMLGMAVLRLLSSPSAERRRMGSCSLSSSQMPLRSIPSLTPLSTVSAHVSSSPL